MSGHLPERSGAAFRDAQFRVTADDEIGSQLNRLGLDPRRDVRWVILTHLHGDHVHGLGAFGAGPEIPVSAQEAQAARVDG